MSKLFSFHQATTTNSFFEFQFTAGEYWLGGNFQNISNPNSLWYNGSTYVVGFEENINLNKVWVFKKTGKNPIEKNTVGDGVTGVEPYNHPTPLLVIDNYGYIYVIQNQFHVTPFRIWKSDLPEDISSFTRLDDFGGNYSYLGLLEQNNLDCSFVTRDGSTYDQTIVKLNLSNTGGYSSLKITESQYASTNVRHYPLMPWKYGTSDYVAGGINHRKDGVIRYYKTSIWLTENKDFETFHNVALDFSKDVSLDGVITNLELETNFKAIGTDSDISSNHSECRMIQINDDIFLSTVSSTVDGITTYTIEKYTIGIGLVDTFDIPVTIKFDYDGSQGISGINFTYMWYNGNNIVISIAEEIGDSLFSNKIYSFNTDLTGWKYQKTLSAENGGGSQLYNGLPNNFDEVNSDYLILGRSIVGDSGTVIGIVTNNKFK